MNTMNTVGAMTMPADFRYREVLLKGKPEHERFDAFRIRHPEMDPARRAKIFAPFDALKGFSGAIADKNIPYEDRSEPGPDAAAELDRRLAVLRSLTLNGRTAKANRVPVSVTCYVPCSDENNDSFGRRGRYISVSGICLKVDGEVSGTILIDDRRIAIDSIRSIDSPSDIFLEDRVRADADPDIYAS